MSLNKLQKSQIKAIMKEPGWGALMIFTGSMVDNYRKENIKADDQFNTLWLTAQREAKCESLLEFFDKLDREVLE